jgi:hypothetical protein
MYTPNKVGNNGQPRLTPTDVCTCRIKGALSCLDVHVHPHIIQAFYGMQHSTSPANLHHATAAIASPEAQSDTPWPGAVHIATEQVLAAPFVRLNQVLQHKRMVRSCTPGAATSLRWHPHPSCLRSGHKPVVEDDGVQLRQQRHHFHHSVVAPLCWIPFLESEGHKCCCRRVRYCAMGPRKTHQETMGRKASRRYRERACWFERSIAWRQRFTAR